MTRHKSRVARRSRRSARRGTRKQSGGFLLSSLNPLNWFKKTDSAAAPVSQPADGTAEQQAASPPTKSWLSRLFISSNDDKANTHTPSAVVPAADNNSPAPHQGGGRKTRHRRRRSPRRHHK